MFMAGTNEVCSERTRPCMAAQFGVLFVRCWLLLPDWLLLISWRVLLLLLLLQFGTFTKLFRFPCLREHWAERLIGATCEHNIRTAAACRYFLRLPPCC